MQCPKGQGDVLPSYSSYKYYWFIIEYIIISESCTLQKHDFWTFWNFCKWLLWATAAILKINNAFCGGYNINITTYMQVFFNFYINKNDHIYNVSEAFSIFFIFKEVIKVDIFSSFFRKKKYKIKLWTTLSTLRIKVLKIPSDTL